MNQIICFIFGLVLFIYNLPNEAEWHYPFRSSTNNNYYFDEDTNDHYYFDEDTNDHYYFDEDTNDQKVHQCGWVYSFTEEKSWLNIPSILRQAKSCNHEYDLKDTSAGLSPVSENKNPEIQQIGAQVFIEPGQTDEEIDHWFATMSKHNMFICRIRLFENYLRDEDGHWDFTLFDKAFDAAEKYNVKIFVTLFPSVSADNVGGFKFPTDEAHLVRISEYITAAVGHYKDHPALYGWVLQNEPGSGGRLPETNFTEEKFLEWKAKQPVPSYQIKYLAGNYEREKFIRDYETWFLGWIAGEVYKHNPGSHTHLNSHAIFDLLPEYDFSEWRKFLSSHGASMHPGFHYGYFNRSQYPLAMSANSDIVRAGAGKQPFWITEMQGGNNTYSAVYPLCPTKEEIAQWLWTTIGCGTRGIIFWCLNPRASAAEAGEWALLTFNDEPSDRMVMAGKVAETILQNRELFEMAMPVVSNVTLMYNQESMFIHNRKISKFSGPVVAREKGAIIQSSLAYCEALMELGVPSKWSEMDDFNWNKKDYTGEVIILAHLISIPSRHWENLKHFVRNGGKIIASGMTGYFDEYEHCIMKTGFPFMELFGATMSEFMVIQDYFELKFDNTDITLPAHFWKGYIKNMNAEIIASDGEDIFAVRNNFGKGEVIWIPSLIGLTAWHHDNSQLAKFLSVELRSQISHLPVYFKKQEKQVLMRAMKSGNSLITILVNKSDVIKELELEGISNKVPPNIIFGDYTYDKITGKSIKIAPEQTLVLKWNQVF